MYIFKKDLDEFKKKCSRLMVTLSKITRENFNRKYKYLIMLKITLEVKKKLLPPDDAYLDEIRKYEEKISLLIKEVEKWKQEYTDECDKLNKLNDIEYNKVLTNVVRTKISELKKNTKYDSDYYAKIEKLEKYVADIDKLYNKDQSLRNQAISKFYEYTLIVLTRTPPPQHILDELSAIEQQLDVPDIRDEPVTQREEVEHDQRGNEVKPSKRITHGVDTRSGEIYKLSNTDGVGYLDQRELATKPPAIR